MGPGTLDEFGRHGRMRGACGMGGGGGSKAGVQAGVLVVAFFWIFLFGLSLPRTMFPSGPASHTLVDTSILGVMDVYFQCYSVRFPGPIPGYPVFPGYDTPSSRPRYPIMREQRPNLGQGSAARTPI